MALEFSAALKRIPIYPAAGGYSLPEDVALLASNESPDPPLEAVQQAAAAVLSGTNRYPDPSYSSLRQALSDRTGVAADRIAVGNGSCDILMAAGEALLEPGAELVYAWPSFSVYPHLEAASGATALRVPLNDAHEHDLEAMLEQITVATRLVIVCNPNNPTSTALPFEDIKAFVERVPRNVCILLDEAYCEYNTLGDPDESLELLDKHPNLVILRTFSKVYGLCGLRVGYALCGDRDFAQAVAAVRQPFVVNIAAQAAAIEALKHQDAISERVERAVVARMTMEDGLNELGIQPAASQANFCWFDLPSDVEEADIVDGLRDRGILVRAGGALGRPGALRVTYGTPQQNDRFLAALRELLP